MRIKDERCGRQGRPGAVPALSTSMAAWWPAGALAAPPAKRAAAPGGDVLDAGGPNAIADGYIVVLKDPTVRLKGVHALTLAAEADAKVTHTHVAA